MEVPIHYRAPSPSVSPKAIRNARETLLHYVRCAFKAKNVSYDSLLTKKVKKTIAIIGAVISGLSAARLILTTAEVKLLDKAEKAGGLIKCDYVAGNLFHKVGGRVFNSKNKEDFNWFWSQFDLEKEFLKIKRKFKILYGGNIIGYPLESHLYEFGKDVVTNVIAELQAIQSNSVLQSAECDNFESFLKANFSNTL